MANYKVAYGKKENISYAIERGIIPPGCIILTEDSNEILFYDLNRRLDSYEQKYIFNSREEVEEWVEKYDCSGQILSVHENGACNIYVVNHDNTLSPISGRDYVVQDKDPTEEDINYDTLSYWINSLTDELFILASIKDDKAIWKNLTKAPQLTFDQDTPSSRWVVNHGLGKIPTVNVIDAVGCCVVGEVSHTSTDTLLINFSEPISGKAYLS